MSVPHNLENTTSINLEFYNGSIGTISYFSNGNKLLPKELIEVFCSGQVAVVNDFKQISIYDKRKKKKKLKKQDKGHAQEIKEFIGAIHNGSPCPISFKECYHSTLATFAVLDSIHKKRRIEATDAIIK